MKKTIKKMLREDDWGWAKEADIPSYIEIEESPVKKPKKTNLWVINLTLMYGDADMEQDESITINSDEFELFTNIIKCLESVKFYGNVFRDWGIDQEYEDNTIASYASKNFGGEVGDIISDVTPFTEHYGYPAISSYRVRYYDEIGTKRNVNINSEELKNQHPNGK